MSRARRAVEHLTEGAEGVRLANRETHTGPLTPPELYDPVGAVVTLVDRLPQFVLFAQRSAERATTSELFDDGGAPPRERLAEVTAALGDAYAALVTTGRALGRAHSALSHLGTHYRPEDDQDQDVQEDTPCR